MVHASDTGGVGGTSAGAAAATGLYIVFMVMA